MNTKFLLLIYASFLILLAPDIVFSKQDPLADLPEYKEAYARLDAKDYRGSIVILEKLLTQKAGSAGLYFALGKASQELGNNKEALSSYNKAIQLDPKNSKTFSNRGLVLGSFGDLKAALADFTKAITIDPSYYQAYSNRGVARGALGDNKGAIADFSQAISINPRFSAAWRNRGITREMTGDLKGACADWSKAAGLGQNEAIAWVKAQCK